MIDDNNNDNNDINKNKNNSDNNNAGHIQKDRACVKMHNFLLFIDDCNSKLK